MMRKIFMMMMGMMTGFCGLCQETGIQQLIADALANKEKKVVLPEGIHRVKAVDPKESYHINIRNAADLEIRGNKTTLVFENPQMGGIRFENCRNVTLSGVTLDWDPVPNPQGEIIAISPDGAWVDIKVDKGFIDDPKQFTKEGGAMVYDPKNRLLKPGFWNMFKVRLFKERAGILRLKPNIKNQVAASGAAVGDLLAVRAKGGKMGIRLLSCTGMIIEDVTLWSAPGIGLQEVGGDGGNKYIKYKVTRGPASSEGGGRLLSSAADAFHSSGVRRGPIVDQCVLEYQGDDGIAIHGAYSLVVSSGESEKLQISPKQEFYFREGDRLKIYDGITYQLKDETEVVSTESAKTPNDPAVAKEAWKKYKVDSVKSRYFNLVVAKPVKVNSGDLISSPDWVGNGFSVTNNILRHNRAQGMRIKASDGIIENNRIEGVMASGIALGPEFADWLESDYVKNVKVKNNTICRSVLGGASLKHHRALHIGAISVYAMTPKRLLPPGYGNSNLLIEGNTIEDCGGIGMLITCTKDSVIKDNIVGRTKIMQVLEGGKAIGIDPDASIYLDESADIKLENNKTGGKGIILGEKVQNIESDSLQKQ